MDAKVGVIMGSQSDLPVMKGAIDMLKEFKVPYEIEVVSAHRSPERMLAYGKEAEKRGLRIIIAGAGGAAHLPGMIAAVSTLPVIGVPVKSSNSVDGWDSILSILQMPGGVPVATVALNASKNAGLLAVQILATADVSLMKALYSYKEELKEKVAKMNKDIDKAG